MAFRQSGRVADLTATIRDPTFAQIVWSHLDSDLVTGKNANVVLAHLAGYMSRYDMSVFQFHSEHGIWKGIYNHAFHLYGFFFSH